MANNKLVTSRTKYYEALEKLRQMPNNLGLKQHTLLLGRNYIKLAQEIVDYNGTKKVKEFIPFNNGDLIRDIDETCEEIADDERNQYQLIEERLTKLSELEKHKFISEQEYEKRRKEIINEI